MLSTGFKLYFGACLAAVVAAITYGYSTGGARLGPLTVGFKGAVGEHVGYAVLIVLAFVLAGLTGLSIAFRDADPEAVAALVGAETAPVGQAPLSPSMWPIVAAFGAGATVVGLVMSPAIFVAGLALVAVAAAEWAISAWADRATGDPEANRVLRQELMKGYEVPALAVLGFGVIVLALSRVLLTVSKLGSTIVATVVALVIFGGAIALAMRPKVSKNLATALVLVGGVALLGAGVVAAVNGEREFEHHEVHEEGEGEEAVTEGTGTEGTESTSGTGSDDSDSGTEGADSGAGTETAVPAEQGAEG